MNDCVSDLELPADDVEECGRTHFSCLILIDVVVLHKYYRLNGRVAAAVPHLCRKIQFRQLERYICCDKTLGLATPSPPPLLPLHRLKENKRVSV